MVTVRKKTDYNGISELLSGLLDNVPYEITNLANISALLKDYMAGVNWVGFYIMKEGKLVLGPFQGKIACAEIEVGFGVCGTAVKEDESIIVDNVLKFPGHIACDTASRSEIVIPIHQNGEIYGVLDIDSPFEKRFTVEDKIGLEMCVKILEEFLPKMI